MFIGDISTVSTDTDFHKDLCRAFIAADIPLYKIRHVQIKSFFEKYTSYKVPSETNLRTKYVTSLYNDTMEYIKSRIKNHFLWLSIDETTDIAGRNVANVVIGILDSDEKISKQTYLINIVNMDSVNHTSIARLFNDSIAILGPDFDRDSILLFITDAAPYMVKASHAIQTFYPKVTHVTCLIHGLHRVCEKIRSSYGKVDRMIANIKKVFIKAPSRVQIFKNLEPDLPLPPQPIITRWGTWLQAVLYYAKHYGNINKILETLDNEEAASIQIAQDLLSDKTVKADIIYIAANYGCLEDSIKRLETTGLLLSTQIKIVEDVVQSFDKICTSEALSIRDKLLSILRKNTGYATMKNISASLNGLKPSEKYDSKYDVNETLAFKFAPITSIQVERNFSMYKNVLRTNRQSFLFEALKEIFVIYCNDYPSCIY